MKKEEMLQAQLSYVREHQDIDESLFERTMNWFLEVERLHEMLKLLTETISGQPKGRFDMLRGLFLHHEGIMRPAELAIVADMTRASSSHNLDILERDNLIHRKTDPNDRRSAMVSLTPKGHKLMSEILPSYLKAIEAVAQTTSSPLTDASVLRIKGYNAHIESLVQSIKDSQNK
ncbi:DNA-binding transcriptional regulator, MarR family [Desulfoluna spongiiphila]|uniref:DNA-binding transcriptional regulator, MarR family n=2 Tax=Desulfoluna spongiiphila TaxID=419481 RepID=A0A1G5DV03_9BACT|nr:DNA-binding transcriptional regulator, MarR family [Desulfoluna spongiiphila]